MLFFRSRDVFLASLWRQNEETEHGYFFTEWLKFNLCGVRRNIYPSDQLQLLKSVNEPKELCSNWCLGLKEFGGTNKKKLLVVRLQETELRFYRSSSSSSPPHLFLESRQQIVLLHLLFSFCLQLHLPHPPDIPTISPPHISISPLSLCLTWAARRFLILSQLSALSIYLGLVNCHDSVNHWRIL